MRSDRSAYQPVAQYSGAVRAALLLIRGYKVLISPYFHGSCRFLPSCADYAAEAVATHGVARGSWLAARRLARCHPLCAAGYDPVPTGMNEIEAGPTGRAPQEPRGSSPLGPTGPAPQGSKGAALQGPKGPTLRAAGLEESAMHRCGSATLIGSR